MTNFRNIFEREIQKSELASFDLKFIESRNNPSISSWKGC